MSGGFGRKGVGTGTPVDSSAANGFGNRSPAASPGDRDDGLSSQARAFLAAERAGRGEPAPARTADVYASAAAFQPVTAAPERSLLLAYVLWWFGGIIGAHRFYLGAYRSGIAMPGLLFGGLIVGQAVKLAGVAMILGCMIWVFVDAFFIPGLRRRHAASLRTGEFAYAYA